MTYVALLRGINVGGNNKVSMALLKTCFEQLGFSAVRTYINSGNIIFETAEHGDQKLVAKIEAAIEAKFGFAVRVVVRSQKEIASVEKALPTAWINNQETKTDVMFLWKDYDNPKVLDQLHIKPDIDDVTYIASAIIWRVDRSNINKSGLLRIVGTDFYKHVTIRNANTLRKLHALMQK